MVPYTNGLETLNINEEGFERKNHPDEQIFHELLQHTMQQQDDGDVSFVSGVPAVNSIMQAEIAGRYANAAQDRFVERAQEARRYGAGIEFAPTVRGLGTQQTGDRRTQQLQRGVQEQRAERDLWSLLETLTSANLLYDIDEQHCEEVVQRVLAGLPITASIPDYLQAAFSVDDRLRKGAVLKEWIEKASMDLVTEAPAPRGEPWSETLNRVLRSRHDSTRRGRAALAEAGSVQSLHPDGQIDPEGSMLALDGVDRLDQENLLKSIWQLVRCGLVQRAQQLAEEHRLYWLSASLQGIATHFYKPVTLPGDPDQLEHSEEIVGVSRIGNLRQPIWLRTCWLYATKLSSSRDSKNTQLSASGLNEARSSSILARGMLKEDSLVGVLECGIYAALCNHTQVLAASPLVPAWQDKVWVFLKAAHERDIARITHQYRCDKAARSKHFAGCDTATLGAERELFDLAKTEVGHLSAASCMQIFNKVPPPSGGRTAEAFLLSLQAAVMEGRSGIEHYISTTLTECLRSTESFPGKEQVLRVFCHFCIWLKYAHADNAALSDLLSLETMYLAVERYIDLLIENKQRSLVAAYAAYLSRPRRIHKYAQLLRTMQSSSATVGTDAAEVLQLANTFFPADVMDITRTVVEGAHAPTAAITAPASTQKRTGQIRAPPLASLSSPINMGQAFSQTPAPRSVRFAFAEGEEPLEGEDAAATADTPFASHSTPTKFSVRGRTATPRRPLGVPRTPGSAGSSMGGSELLPGTPGVGSELMMLSDTYAADEHRASSREQSVHTRLRAAANDGVSSTAAQSAEMQQLESLRWLFFDATHRFEAVKQANRFAVSFLLHRDGMKLAQLRALLADYVPLDSVAVGAALIEQRRQAVRDVEQQYLHDHEASSVQQLPSAEREHVQTLQSELSLEEGLWDAQVCKLHLWRDFTAATQDVDMFHRAVQDFQTDSCRQLSLPSAASGTQGVSGLARHRSKIARTASTAAESILRTVTCAADSDPPNPADGFKDIWAQNESAVSAYITHNAGLLLHGLQDLLSKEDSDELDGRLSEAEWRSVGVAVAALWAVVREVYGGEAQAQHPVRLAVQALVELGLPSSRSGEDEQEGGAMSLEDTPSDAAAGKSSIAQRTCILYVLLIHIACISQLCRMWHCRSSPCWASTVCTWRTCAKASCWRARCSTSSSPHTCRYHQHCTDTRSVSVSYEYCGFVWKSLLYCCYCCCW